MWSPIDAIPAELLDTATLAGLGTTVGILATAYVASRAVLPRSVPGRYRALFVWHAFDALIHFTLEGSFLYHCFFSHVSYAEVGNYGALAPTAYNFLGHQKRVYGAQAGGDNPFAQLWMLYAQADKRWAGADLTLISLELLTVFVAGPLACVVCYGIWREDDRMVSVVVVVVATMELYGGFLTFCPEWLTGNGYLNGSDNWMHKWVFLWFFNSVWVVMPVYAICVAVADVNRALAVRGRALRVRKGK